MIKPYIIIGCHPRGASLFMVTALRELGLEIGHEEPGDDGVVGWQHLCMNHPWTLKALRKGRRRPKVYVMQHRHPVPTINSMAAMYFRRDWPPLAGGLSAAHICRMNHNDTPVMKAMKLYYYLNRQGLQDRKFKIRYRVEKIDEAWPDIAEAVGMPGVDMPNIPRDTNTRRDMGKYPELEWGDIYNSFPEYGTHIRRIASIMGYNVGDWENTDLSQWACRAADCGEGGG